MTTNAVSAALHHLVRSGAVERVGRGQYRVRETMVALALLQWVEKLERRSREKRDASVHDVRLHLVEATVDLAESVAANEEDALYGWFMPRCPRCNTSLSQKLASSRLICLNCGAEYTVKEVSADDD